MNNRKYPMNHASSKPTSPDSAYQDPCDMDVNLDFIDEFTRQVNSFTERINTWVAKNKPAETKLSALAEISRTDPVVPPEAGKMTLTNDELQVINDELQVIIDSIVYGGPRFEDEETESQEQEIAKLPLYAGPEDLVFGDSDLFGSQSKTDKESNTSTADYDHLVFKD